MENYIKEFRNQIGVTEKEVAEKINIPLRTYKRYEGNPDYGNDFKRTMILNLLKKQYEITEDKGILNIEKINKLTNPVFEKYGDKIKFCYLFGSYAKGYATEKSDIDLCVSTELKGLEFVGFVEELKNVLIKKVEVIRLNDIGDNTALLNEIMKDGIRIYKR